MTGIQAFTQIEGSDSTETRVHTDEVFDTRVDLPDDVTCPYEVFVNGVRQQRGDDYEQVNRSIFFTRELKQEGSLGFLRWTSIFLGIAGTYRPDDWVDVVCEVDGHRSLKTRLAVAAIE
jgi:hypothetical protein